jgi:hypothetical protein
MATVLEGILPKSCILLCFFACAQKTQSKEMFPVYGSKCLSCKAVHNWVEKFPQGRSKVADDARSGAEVAETTVKRFLCCGFRQNGKAMGQLYQCFLPGSNNTSFTFHIHL